MSTTSDPDFKALLNQVREIDDRLTDLVWDAKSELTPEQTAENQRQRLAVLREMEALIKSPNFVLFKGVLAKIAKHLESGAVHPNAKDPVDLVAEIPSSFKWVCITKWVESVENTTARNLPVMRSIVEKTPLKDEEVINLMMGAFQSLLGSGPEMSGEIKITKIDKKKGDSDEGHGGPAMRS